MTKSDFLIGVVGPCGAGKTTLVKNLRENNYVAKAIAQEHSYVPDMWQKLSKPSFLIYLSASYETTIERKKFAWTFDEYSKQLGRLKHAFQHADLVIQTDNTSIEEVFIHAEMSLSEIKFNELE